MSDQQLEAEVSTTETEDTTVEESSASTPENDAGEQPVITPEAQKIIAEKAFKEREAKREANEAKRELEEIRRQQATAQVPTIPPIPDRYDFDTDAEYELAIRDRDDKIRKVATHEQEQALEKQRAEEAEKAHWEEQARQLQTKVVNYASNADKLGIDKANLETAGRVVETYLRQDIQVAMLDDEDAPVVTMYLASNPQAIDQLNNANSLNIGKIYADIAGKAAALKPKQSSAPPPADILEGGAPPLEDPRLDGMTFE